MGIGMWFEPWKLSLKLGVLFATGVGISRFMVDILSSSRLMTWYFHEGMGYTNMGTNLGNCFS